MDENFTEQDRNQLVLKVKQLMMMTSVKLLKTSPNLKDEYVNLFMDSFLAEVKYVDSLSEIFIADFIEKTMVKDIHNFDCLSYSVASMLMRQAGKSFGKDVNYFLSIDSPIKSSWEFIWKKA